MNKFKVLQCLMSDYKFVLGHIHSYPKLLVANGVLVACAYQGQLHEITECFSSPLERSWNTYG